MLVRPRGWHLLERHLLADSESAAGGLAGTVGLSPNSKRAPGMAPRLVDFGFYVFHNARALLERGRGPYVYLPKIESHREARLWNDVFNLAEDHLGLQRGTVKATVPDRDASGRVRDG